MDALRLRVDDGVAWVTLDHPPTNLFDLPLMVELDQLSRDLEADDAVRVVVIDSADPDIWIAHADVELILRIPDNPPDGEELGFFHAMVDRFRTMPKATIGLIEGIARGGGCELASSLDMRFGTYGKTVVAQPESLVGILPGGSGTQRWPRLVGRGRALEVALGGGDIDAKTAEYWGWLNRAFAPGEARPFVERLAARIASVPPDVIALTKRCVDAALGPVAPGLLLEAQLFHVVAMSEEGRRRMQAFLDGGGQDRDAELGGTNFLVP